MAGPPLNQLRVRSDTWEDTYLKDDDAPERPWKKIALAVFLLSAGVALLIAGLVAWFTGSQGGSSIALLTLGSICFIPGFYYTRIAYWAWKGSEGFSLDTIPDI